MGRIQEKQEDREVEETTKQRYLNSPPAGLLPPGLARIAHTP